MIDIKDIQVGEVLYWQYIDEKIYESWLILRGGIDEDNYWLFNLETSQRVNYTFTNNCFIHWNR